MHFRYFDPMEQSVVEGDVAGRADLADLVGHVAGLGNSCNPALELSGDDGSSFVLGVDTARPDRAVVLWTGIDGTTRHSVGGRPSERAVFDLLGARTEVPGHYAVPLAAAVSAAGSYLVGTAPGLPLAVD